MLFSWGEDGDPEDEVSYETVSQKIPTVKSASVYSLLQASKTGDLLLLEPKDKTDSVCFIGVIVNNRNSFFEKDVYLLTESGVYDALPFMVHASTYYEGVFVSRKDHDVRLIKEFFETKIQDVKEKAEKLPLPTDLVRHEKFVCSILKVLLEGRITCDEEFMDDIDEFYEHPYKVTCMYQEMNC